MADAIAGLVVDANSDWSTLQAVGVVACVVDVLVLVELDELVVTPGTAQPAAVNQLARAARVAGSVVDR